ncbi:hypothetical protein GCK72_011768 [Caenorhabditis remanei]|uniref:Domain of unknown function WSN domain-containing protein n=1 Tax=Caenorhabditis remanei TaxID=31234 RepID=A0A6A5HAV7_CAERE|nr:hypothetical protein GCK72_011768 [Caenorhabditis remanei]KAF1763502.1 hypothetical protein GCK72_011768 [Caenorhabditis remanei]
MKVPSFTRFVVIITAIVSTFVPTNAIESHDLSFVNKGFKNQNSSHVIDRLAATARVITAITLQNGLSDKSISVDDVIAELLNFEPHELKNLETLDKKTVENFLKKLDDFKLYDVTVNDARTLGNMYKLKEVWSQVGSTIKFPNDAEYKKLDNIKSLQVSGLDQLKFKPAIDILNQSILTETHVAEVKNHLNLITTKIESIKGTVDIGGLIKILNQVKPLQFVVQVFTIYGEINAFTNLRKPVSDGLAQELGELKDLVAQSKSSSLDSLAKLVSSRFVHHPIDRLYTSGFINGYKDLNLLSVDGDNVRLFNSTTLQNMKGIHQLSKTTSPFKKLDDEWNEMFSLEMYKSVQDIASLQKLLLSITVAPSIADVNQFIKDVKDCAKASYPSNDVKTLKDISENTNTVFKKLITIRGALQSIEKLKSEYIPILATSTPIETIVQLKKLVMKLESDIKVLSDGEPIVNVDMKIADSDLVTGFKNYFSSHIGSLNCIRDIKSRFGEVTLSAMSLGKVREMKKDAQVSKDVKKVLAGASESLKSLTEIRSTFQALKVQPIDDHTIPNALKNISKPFGEAVAALVLGKDTISKSSEFEDFVRKSYVIEKNIDAIRTDMKITIKNNWGNFVGTSQDIRSLFIKLDELVGKIEGTKNSTLQDIGQLFTNLPKFVDVDLLTDDRLNAVELFVKDGTTPEQTKLLDEFKKSLLELSKLDLKFSRFQKSLNSMSDTINKLVGMMSGISSQVTATTTGGAAVESVSSWHDLTHIICYVVVFLVVVTVIVIYCVCLRKTIDYDALNTLEMENGLKKDEKEKENVKKGKCKVFVWNEKYKVFQKRMKEATDKQKQKLAGHSASGSSSATNTGDSATPSGSTTNTGNKVTSSGSTANVAGGSANPSGSGTNNAAASAPAVNKAGVVPVKGGENEKKGAAATGDTKKAGGSWLQPIGQFITKSFKSLRKKGNNVEKTCGNKTGVSEKPAYDVEEKVVDDYLALYPQKDIVKPESFANEEQKRRWIIDAFEKIEQRMKEDREEERNRDPSTQSSAASSSSGNAIEDAKALRKAFGLPDLNLQVGIAKANHVGRNDDPTRDDTDFEFSEKNKK